MYFVKRRSQTCLTDPSTIKYVFWTKVKSNLFKAIRLKVLTKPNKKRIPLLQFKCVFFFRQVESTLFKEHHGMSDKNEFSGFRYRQQKPVFLCLVFVFLFICLINKISYLLNGSAWKHWCHTFEATAFDMR